MNWIATGVLVLVIVAAQYVALNNANLAYGIAPKSVVSSSSDGSAIDPYTLSSFAMGLLIGKAVGGRVSYGTGMAVTTALAVVAPKAKDLLTMSGPSTLTRIDKTSTNAVLDAAAAIFGYTLSQRLSWMVVLGLVAACEFATFYFRGDGAVLNALDLVAPASIKKTIMTWRLLRVPYEDYRLLLMSGARGVVQPGDLPPVLTTATCKCPKDFEFYENNLCHGYLKDTKTNETWKSMPGCNDPVYRLAPGIVSVPKSNWPKN